MSRAWLNLVSPIGVKQQKKKKQLLAQYYNIGDNPMRGIYVSKEVEGHGADLFEKIDFVFKSFDLNEIWDKLFSTDL